MEDTLEPIELTAAELNAVAGGAAVATNLAVIPQLQTVGNRSGGGGFASTNLQLGIVTQVAVALNL